MKAVLDRLVRKGIVCCGHDTWIEMLHTHIDIYMHIFMYLQAYSTKALHDRLAREGVLWCCVDICVDMFTYTYVYIYIHRHTA